MAAFSAKDVQGLRQSTGVGMLDAKKALEANDGDVAAATKWLREKGLASAAKRTDRDASQGAVAVVRSGNAIAAVELRSETDFVAKSVDFIAKVNEMAAAVAADGEDAMSKFTGDVEQMLITLKENISVGKVVRFEVADGQVADAYLHSQDGRDVNAVLVVLNSGTEELAHDLAVHAAFTKPQYLSRDEVPAAEVAAERETIETISRNEGKPEASLEKVVEGRLNGWFKERCLLEQSYVRDEKQSVAQLLGSATVANFAQIIIGA